MILNIDDLMFEKASNYLLKCIIKLKNKISFLKKNTKVLSQKIHSI